MSKNYLDPFDPRYSDTVARLASLTEPVLITRDNIDELLDRYVMQIHMTSGRWWWVRRNGATKLWKRDPLRIRIPIKYGLRGYGAIETSDFCYRGSALRPDFFRVSPPIGTE